MSQPTADAATQQSVVYDPSNPDIGVVVGIPARGKVRAEWAIMYRSLQGPVNGSMTTKTVLNAPIAEARQAVAEWAIDNNAKYLYFLDDDVLVPQNGLRRLLYLLDNNPEWDLVSGVYVTKVNPKAVPADRPEPLIFGGKPGNPGAFWDWKLDTTFPIWGCGMGCALIRVSSIAKLEKPYFAWEDKVDGMNSYGVGEDMYFCKKLLDAGGTLMCDGGLLCGHIDGEGIIHSLPIDSNPIQSADADALKRYTLYEQVLADKGKKAAKAMSGIAGS